MSSSDTASTQNPFASYGGTLSVPLLFKQPVSKQTTATAFTVSPAQSGTLFSLPSVGAVITLPAVASSAGSIWKFVLSAANGTTAWTVTAPANTLKGAVLMGATTATSTVLIMAGDAGTSVAFSTTALAGDHIEVTSDGTYYYVSGVGAATASFTVA